VISIRHGSAAQECHWRAVLFGSTALRSHNHFAHRASITDLEFKRFLKQGRTSLLIALLILSLCLLLSKALLSHGADTWAVVERESLRIAGWIAMWRSTQIYLYNWWPLRRPGRAYEKLARMSLEVLPKAKT